MPPQRGGGARSDTQPRTSTKPRKPRGPGSCHSPVWTECVTQQHAERMVGVSGCHGLYKMLANAYQSDGAVPLDERRAVQVLTGIIAAGGLRGNGEGVFPNEGLAPVVPSTRAELYHPSVRVDAELREQQVRRREVRSAAWAEQMRIDMERNKRHVVAVPPARIRGKSAPVSFKVKRARVAKKPARSRVSSAALAEQVESSLSAVGGSGELGGP